MRRIAVIIAVVTPMLEGIDWSQRTDQWVGSRPCTVDGLPLVGRCREEIAQRLATVLRRGGW